MGIYCFNFTLLRRLNNEALITNKFEINYSMYWCYMTFVLPYDYREFNNLPRTVLWHFK